MATYEQGEQYILKRLSDQGLDGFREVDNTLHLVRIALKSGDRIGAVYIPNPDDYPDDEAYVRAIDAAFLEAITVAGREPALRRG